MSEQASELTVKELDDLIIKMNDAYDCYEKLKKQSSEAYSSYVEIETQVVEALQKSGKRKYHISGLGTVSVVETYSFRTPKTIEDKKAFLEYVKAKYGEKFMADKFTMHSQTLSSFCKSELAENESNPAFKIPGIDDPQGKVTLRFLGEKK